MTLRQYSTAARLWRLQRCQHIVIGRGCRISGSARFFAGPERIRVGGQCEIDARAIPNCYGGPIVIWND